MHVIPIGPRRGLAFGLQWEVVDAFGKRAQIKRLRADGYRYVARYQQTKGRGGSDENLGVASRLEAPKGMIVYSAAGQAAMLPMVRGKNILIVIEDKDANDSTVVAVVGIYAGNVVVDNYVPGIQAQAEIDKYVGHCRKNAANFTWVGRSDRWPVAERFDWEDFVADLPQKPGIGEALGIRRSTGVRVNKLRDDTATNVATIACAALVVGGYAYYKGVVEGREQEEARRRMAEQQSPITQYRRQVGALLAQAMPIAKDAIPVIRQGIGDIPVNFAGWVLKQISCTAAGCIAEWQRKEGTYAEFAERARPEWKPLRLSDNLISITHELPIVLPKATLPEPQAWPTFEAFLHDEASRWQRFKDIKLQISLKPPAVQAVPPGVQPAVVERFPEAVYGATWSVSDSQWWLSEGFDKSPATVALTKLTVKFNGTEMLFNGEGVAYVKK
uniref:type 4b pilus protein PilO2 n=1 Tax=Cupriavidus gilardii TaxID=82541 RepID=UPI002478809E|nr:type 4b pilus protein PilO2 [Cupriavidus gilardii]WDE72710.1 hypothetical protein [Cupriavidus gilardii]